MKSLGNESLVNWLDFKDKQSLMGLGFTESILREWFFPFSPPVSTQCGVSPLSWLSLSTYHAGMSVLDFADSRTVQK